MDDPPNRRYTEYSGHSAIDPKSVDPVKGFG